MQNKINNSDIEVISDFGNEWKAFDYSSFDERKLFKNFERYFSIFPFTSINDDSEGFDMGCGSGRWARFMADKVKKLNCVEPSEAIEIAKKNLQNFKNIDFYNETTETCSLPNNSQDFGYCLGVLHHIPDVQKALNDCSRLLKKNAPFLLYLYYDFENRPIWYRYIWWCSNFLRLFISKLSPTKKKIICSIIALAVYWPLSRLASILGSLKIPVSNIPLSDYKDKTFYELRNDALDRFGTRLEQRFSREKISRMLQVSGLNRIKFTSHSPYWICICFKK